jgi:hypothetical protein
MVNNCRLAFVLNRTDDAQSWGERACQLADAAGTPSQRAYAAFERAHEESRAGNLLLAADLYRRAGELFEGEKQWFNMATAFGNAANLARRNGDTPTSLDLRSRAAYAWEKEEGSTGAAHRLTALVDLSAEQADSGNIEQASATLAQAADLAQRKMPTISALMRAEAMLRRAGMLLLLAEPPAPRAIGPMVLQAWPDSVVSRSESADAELDRVASVIRQYGKGTIEPAIVADKISAFLRSYARHRPADLPKWLFDRLDKPSVREISAAEPDPIPPATHHELEQA